MKRTYLGALLIICAAALVLRYFVIRQYTFPWWDPAIYVGMAKYLYSGGTIAMWEVLRPPLWPVILGIPWILGLNPYIVAQWLVALSSIGTIFVLYVLGEKEMKGLGIAASLIIALSPAYAFFTTVPTNDIPSGLLALIAAYCILRRRFAIAGIITALSFLMRFPNGLFLVPFGLFILIDSIGINLRHFATQSLKKITRLALGFVSLVVPYFIVNYFLFKDALVPLKLGREIIETSGSEPFNFYLTQITIDTPLLLLAIIGTVVYIIRIWLYKKLPASLITLSLLAVVVIGGYMTSLSHKELRYSFGFLPFLAIIAAYGLSFIWNMSRSRKALAIALIVVAIVGGMNMYNQLTNMHIQRLREERKSYYELLPPSSTAITSSPQIMLYSNTKVTGIFSSWKQALNLYESQKDTLNFIAIDTRQMDCFGTPCTLSEPTLQKIINKSPLIYYAREGDIELLIYKLR